MAAISDERGPLEGRLSFSVIIPNYNYGCFLPTAIDSALALDWPDVEVIVVDDGSTDRSRDVLASYSGRVATVLQDNGGHRAACTTGFARSSNEAILFLDSDDALHPQAARRIAEHWTGRTAKVQLQMQRIDAEGRAIGAPFPRFRPVPTAPQIASWIRRTGAYPTPPGSGNAYSRWFLERLLLVEELPDPFMDSALLASAPLVGDVVTVPEPLVYYRVHGANDSDLLAADDRFDREVARAVRRHRWAQLHFDGDTARSVATLRRSREVTQFRAAARALTPHRRSLPDDSDARLLVDVLRSPFQIGPERIGHRLTIAAWCLLVLVAPTRLRRAAIRRRYRR